ncbi:MAG: flagellar hook-length control protein FliK, partial [Candidatus Cloacimonetes bacterium]|nr:flagellar hook-length control protein FliK [Candidatus Cloacimonadota bacterium]
IKHKTVTTNDVSEKVILKNNDKQFGLNNKSQHNGVFLNLKKDTNVKPVSLPNTINMQNISPKYDVGEITQPYNAQTKQNKQNITKINFVENISLHKNHNTFENVEHINLNSGAKVNFVNADNSQIEEPGKTSSAGIISKNIKSKTLERTNESSILISGSQTLKTNTKFMQASNKSLIVKASAFETTPRLKKDQENTTKQLNVHKLKIVGDNVRNKGNIEKLDLNYTIIKDENKSIKPKLSTYEHKASDYKHGKQVNRINKDDYKEIKPHISTPKDQKQTDQSQSNSVYKIKDKANINIKAENNEVKPYVNVQQDIKQSEFIAKKSNSGDIHTKKEFDNYNTISKLVLSDIKTARNAANIAETTTGKILKEPFKSNYAQSYKKYKEKHITELIDNNKDISSQKAKAVSIEVRKFNSVPQVKTSSYKITDIKMKKTITPPFKNNNITDRKQNVDNVKVDKENPIEQVKGIRINQITNNQLTGKTKLDRRESISSPVTKTDKQEQIISKSQFRESDLVPLVKTSSYKITDIKMKKTKENPIEQVNGIRKNQITNNPLTGKTNLDRRESISSSETKTDKQEQINSVNKFNNVINKNKIADAIDNNYHNNISKHDTTIRLTKDIKIDHKAISTKNPKESELIRDSIVKQGLDKSNEENIQIQSGDATKGIKTSNHTIETGRISNQSVSSSLLSGEEKILPKQNVFEKNLHTNTSDDAEFTNAPIDGQLWHRTSHDVLAQQLHNTSLNSKTNLKGNDEMQGFEDTFVHKNAIAYETIQDYLDNNEPLFVQYLDTDGKEKQRSVFIKNNDAKNTQNSSSNSTQNRAISNNKHKENSEYKQDQNQQNFNSFNQMNSKAFSNINSGFNITGSRYSISDFIPKLLETTQSFNREHSIKKAVLEIETNELGYVKTNIEKQGERLIIRFEAEDIQKVKSLKENMHTLEHQLKAQGFEDVLIEYDFHKESRQQSNNQASQQNTSKNQNNQKDNHESLQEEVHTIKRDYGYNSMEYTI